jgi:hypothetical protein
MPVRGFIPLKTPQDLLDKLSHNLARMRHDLTDSYAAFDFFVTAEHILLPNPSRGMLHGVPPSTSIIIIGVIVLFLSLVPFLVLNG